MKNNIYTAIPDWFNKLQSQSTDNTSTTTTQTTIIGGGGSISMSVHNLFIKSDTTITIDDFTISDLFVTDQITDTENWLTTPLLHTLPNTEVSVTTAAQQLYIGAYDKNNNQIKLYQFSEAISTVVIPENCYYLRASSNKTNTDLTIKYVGLNNFDETQQNKLESSSFQNFLTLVEGDEKGVITNSVQNLSLVFQNPLYYTLDKAGNVLISIDRDALFSQSENPTDDRYVTTVANSVQDILSSKNFKEGLSINGIEIVERNGFLYIKGNLATTGGITAYADDPDDPGGSGGLPGGGAIGDIVITGSGNALVDASLSEDHSVITFTKDWLVDAESDQSITGIKDFINGIKLDGQLIKIVDGVLFLDCSIAATGGITAYATMPGEGSSSIMDQLVVDTEYFIITEEGVLTIVPGSVGGISNIYVTGNGNALTTATLSEDGKTISFTKDKTFADDTEIKRIISEFKNEVNEQLKRFVTLDTEQEITAVKHFIEGVTIGSNKHKFYEKDGVLWLEGDIAITGGVTTYATENVDVSTIMDGVAVDEITITKGNDNVLRIKDAGAGSSFDENAMWSALASSSDKQINKSHLTTALTGYATESWVSGKNYAVKATTLAGYGITDGINAVSVTGTGNAVTAASISGHTLTLTKGSTFSLSGHKHAWADITSGKPSTLSGYGITDAYTKTESDNKYPTKTGSGASGTWGINVTGNAGTATKLQTARTLWGRSFDGTGNVSGNLDNVGNINFRLEGKLVSNGSLELKYKNDDTTSLTFTGIVFRPFTSAHNNIDLGASTVRWRDLYIGRNAYVDGITKTEDFYIGGIRLHKTADGVITLEGNLAVTGGITTYAIDPVSASTVMDGVVVDGTTIAKVDGVLKVLNAGGGEAGSVAWGNITGKPSVFSTNIANITDLHSSWDAVLKAQKPNWLTAVSIATISDLHANWDALLKAAPSAYVTRWPTISEVTNKQNLVIKLNGGTTEGTNQFTYNATAAKSLNITASSVGAYTKSESDGRYPTKTGSGASGTWGINISGNASNADKLDNMHLSGIVHSEQGYSTGTTEASGSSRNLSRSSFWRDNDRSRIGIFACHSQDTKYGWELSCGYYSVRPYFSVKSNGSWKSDRIIAFLDDNVSSANQLANTKTLWGQNFNGTQNVSGDMSNVGNINTNYAYVNAKTFAYNPADTHDDGYPWYGFTYGGDNKIHISGYGGILFYNSAGNVLTLATDGRVYATSYVSSDWFRSNGDTGWYSIRGGGGWYMSDTYFIRSYGEKSVYLGNGSYRNAGGNAYSNNLENISEPYNCRYMSETTYNIPTGYIHPFCGWSDSAASGWVTSYVIGSIRNYANNWGEIYFGIYQYEGASRAWKAYMALDGVNRHLYIDGNLMVTGGGTFYGSDIRYKSIIQQIKLSLLDIAKSPSFVYHWNKKEMICDRLNIGGSAQYTQTILPWAVEEKNNLLTMDYATVAYTFAVHTARHLLDYETKTDKEIRKLKNRIKYLEKQLKSLHYEEANIVDN